MKISLYLKKELVFLDLPYTSKRKIIKYLAGKLCSFYNLSCEKEIIANVMMREKVKDTNLGRGLAVAHSRVDLVDKLYMAFGRSDKGVNWGRKDAGLVHYIFLVAGPNRLVNEYLDVLAQISRIMLRHNVIDIIKYTGDPQAVIQAISLSRIRHRKI